METGWTHRLMVLYEIVADVYSTTDQEWIDKLDTLIPDEDDEQLKLGVVFRNPMICLLLGALLSISLLIRELCYPPVRTVFPNTRRCSYVPTRTSTDKLRPRTAPANNLDFTGSFRM